MAAIFRLANTIQHYDWGSPDHLPRALGISNPGRKPFAELWMGAHPGAPSRVELSEGPVALDRLIAASPERTLGRECAAAFGNRLPYLFKLLAAGRPLSIQAHPSKAQAEEGWARENAQGLAVDSPRRNYKDDNHKPEILCAVTRFEGLCGFRKIAETRRLLDLLDMPPLSNIRAELDRPDEGEAIKAFARGISNLDNDRKRALAEHLRPRVRFLAEKDQARAKLWRLVARLSSIAGDDPTAIAPLYLNHIELQPGEAVYLPAGILHAYLDGFGVELMANSDNVLRGGLTTKHIDTDELLKVLVPEPYEPAVLKPESGSDAELAFYPTPAAEFALGVFDARSCQKYSLMPAGRPNIVVVLEGKIRVSAFGEPEMELNKGESVFVEAGAQAPRIEGEGLAFIASVPR